MKRNIRLLASLIITLGLSTVHTVLHAQACSDYSPYLGHFYSGNSCDGFSNPATVTIEYAGGDNFWAVDVYERVAGGAWVYSRYIELNNGSASFEYYVTSQVEFKVQLNGCSSPSSAGQIIVPPPVPATQTVTGYGYACNTSSRAYFDFTGGPAGTSYNLYYYNGSYYNFVGNTTTGHYDLDLYSSSEQNAYYVQATINGCTSPYTQVYIENLILIAPPVSGNKTICVNSATILTANGSGVYRWYNASGQLLPNQTAQLSTGQLQNSTVYRVSSMNGKCESPQTTVPITVQNPLPPVLSQEVKCNFPVKITASASNVTSYEWYQNSGTLIAAQTSNNYYAPDGSVVRVKAVTSIGCKSNFSNTFAASVLYSSSPSVSQSQGCGNSFPITMHAVSPRIGSSIFERFEWYTNASCSGQPVGTVETETGGADLIVTLGAVDVSQAPNKRDYWVRIYEMTSMCYSPITKFTVDNGLPINATVYAYSCSNSELKLNFDGAPTGSLYQVYQAVGGDYMLKTTSHGEQIITDGFVPGDMFYAKATYGLCISERVPVTLDNFYPLHPPGVIAPTSICKDVGHVTITATTDHSNEYRLSINGVIQTNITGIFQVPVSKDITYAVSSLHSVCNMQTQWSPAKKIKVKDIIIPPREVQAACRWQNITLNINIPGATAKWYNSNNQLLSSSPSPSLNLGQLPVGQYIFKAEAISEGCVSTTKGIFTIAVVNSCDENENYIRTFSAQFPAESATEFINEVGNKNNIAINTQYFDGLGRAIQIVEHHNSPLGNDIVLHKEYSQQGIEVLSFLPYQATAAYPAAFKENAAQDQHDFYGTPPVNVTGDERPFGETMVEASPLNRPVKSYGPGADWDVNHNNKFIGYEYFPNTHGTGPSLSEEKIVAWKIDSSLPIRSTALTGFIETGGYYSSGQLFIKSTKDEHGNEVREYTNKEGQVILKKVQAVDVVTSLNNNAQWALTYYIYDNFGNLRFVLQPNLGVTVLASNTYTPTQDDLDRLAFQYKYDERQRMVEKKVPGADLVYMVYDKLDRLMLTQDGNQRKDASGGQKKEWTFTKYDKLNRPVITGIYTHSAFVERSTMAGLISDTNLFETYTGATAPLHGYSNTVFPTEITGIQVLTVTYYDTYTFKIDFGLAATNSFGYVSGDIAGQENEENTSVKGLLTGSKVNILGTTDYLWNVTYYDKKYRVIQAKNQNHKGGIDRVTNLYDFVRLKESKSTHNNGSVSYSTHRKYDYDHAGRLTNTWHKFHTQPGFVLLQSNQYNELGQLVTKKLHSTDNGTNFKQHLDIRYNIRGWLTRINNSDLTADNDSDPRDHFGMNLLYNEVLPGINNIPQYNGNIRATKWSTNQGFDDTKERAYKFTYDPLNRLTGATHQEKVTGWNASGSFHEDNITYNLNGGMKTLSRKGANGLQMDNLVFDYATSGNQVQSVSDSWDKTKGFVDGNVTGNDYAYDANGSRNLDKNKGITSITYNYLNQPDKITFQTGNYLRYTYDATGRKLSQGVYDATNTLKKKTDYVGEFFYENDTLKYIGHEEGRYNTLASAYEYELRDHLGNNRVTFTTKEEQDAATATMETANATTERSKFVRYDNARKVYSPLFDKTNGTLPGYAIRLSGSANEKEGLARTFAVVPGDVVKTEVYVKYIDTNSSNWTAALNTLLGQIAGGTAPTGTVIDGASYSTSTSSFPYAGLLNTLGSSGNGPKAYLNWLVFDKNFVFKNGGYVRMSDAAREYGQDVAHEKLSAEFTINEPGFVYVYLSNENETLVEVYMDDLVVTLQKSPVINSTEYYPFGLTAASYSREHSLKQDQLYNGKEIQDELNLGVYDYGARMYDPSAPVWWQVDPLAEKYYSISPYAFVANNPILFIDPDGREIWIAYGDNQKVKYENGKLYNEDGSKYKGKNDFVSTAYKSLNNMNSSKNGKTVLGELSSSENAFTFTNTFAKDSKGNDMKDVLSFSENKDGGGEIKAGALTTIQDEGQKVESVAHELFHGYQHENKQSGASVTNEVQAYLFGRSVALQSGMAFDYSFGKTSYVGDMHQNAMFNLLTNPKFDSKELQQANLTFKVGSRANVNGIYNKTPYTNRKPLINRFYPLTPP